MLYASDQPIASDSNNATTTACLQPTTFKDDMESCRMSTPPANKRTTEYESSGMVVVVDDLYTSSSSSGSNDTNANSGDGPQPIDQSGAFAAMVSSTSTTPSPSLELIGDAVATTSENAAHAQSTSTSRAETAVAPTPAAPERKHQHQQPATHTPRRGRLSPTWSVPSTSVSPAREGILSNSRQGSLRRPNSRRRGDSRRRSVHFATSASTSPARSPICSPCTSSLNLSGSSASTAGQPPALPRGRTAPGAISTTTSTLLRFEATYNTEEEPTHIYGKDDGPFGSRKGTTTTSTSSSSSNASGGGDARQRHVHNREQQATHDSGCGDGWVHIGSTGGCGIEGKNSNGLRHPDHQQHADKCHKNGDNSDNCDVFVDERSTQQRRHDGADHMAPLTSFVQEALTLASRGRQAARHNQTAQPPGPHGGKQPRGHHPLDARHARSVFNGGSERRAQQGSRRERSRAGVASASAAACSPPPPHLDEDYRVFKHQIRTIQRRFRLNELPYYHGWRRRAWVSKQLLRPGVGDGTFLIHFDMVDNQLMLLLSLCTPCYGAAHVPIELVQDQTVIMEESHFASIATAVAHFRQNPLNTAARRRRSGSATSAGGNDVSTNQRAYLKGFLPRLADSDGWEVLDPGARLIQRSASYTTPPSREEALKAVRTARRASSLCQERPAEHHVGGACLQATWEESVRQIAMATPVGGTNKSGQGLDAHTEAWETVPVGNSPQPQPLRAEEKHEAAQPGRCCTTSYNASNRASIISTASTSSSVSNDLIAAPALTSCSVSTTL